MNKDKGFKDKIIEFFMVSAAILTTVTLLGIKLKASIALAVLGVGGGYITISHLTNFFRKMNNNIEEIKNYIKQENPIESGVIKMDKKGKIRWLVVMWSIILGLLIILLLKTLFKL